MLVKYSLLLLLLLQLSSTTRISNSSSQRDTRLVDQRVKQIFQQNLTDDDNEEEHLIHGHTEQAEDMNKIQDGNENIGTDNSNLTGSKNNISFVNLLK
jgi:hypothetical protein